jgi:23S rRNA (cytidine1920-2'-O)/16S rRNA (cytidine1409-2'-O)-methyltransferase
VTGRKGRARRRRLVDLVASGQPQLEDPDRAIRAGEVSVDGLVIENPASLVHPDAVIAIRRESPLRGEAKLEAALDRFEVPVDGRVALDVGAAAGGFTNALLRAGAAKVYAVDAGFGQLLGHLRQDPRVVNLERTNLSALDRQLVPEEIGVVSADLSYLALGEAVGQLTERVELAAGADLLGLVKPQFELGLPDQPTSRDQLEAAVEAAVAGVERAGWQLEGTMESPVRGSRGSIEFLLHAVWEDR